MGVCDHACRGTVRGGIFVAGEGETKLPFFLSRHALIGRSVPGIGDLRVLHASASFDGNRGIKMVGGRAIRSAAHSGW